MIRHVTFGYFIHDELLLYLFRSRKGIYVLLFVLCYNHITFSARHQAHAISITILFVRHSVRLSVCLSRDTDDARLGFDLLNCIMHHTTECCFLFFEANFAVRRSDVHSD